MLTKKGIIKRTPAESFTKIRATGIRCASLREDDELVFCALSTGEDTIIIATAHGQGIRFKEGEVRSMGRQAAGVIGIRLKGDDFVVGMEVISSDAGDILFATQNGYGKKVSVQDFRVAHRGGVGVRTIPTTGRNGDVIGLTIVYPDSNILLIDQAGKIIRLPAKEVRTMGRQAKGVRLVRLDKSQLLASISAFRDASDDESGDEPKHGGGIIAAVRDDNGVRRIVAPREAEHEVEMNQQQAGAVMTVLEEEDFLYEEPLADTQADIFGKAEKEDEDPFSGF
jgi:DNA gyrase subunit A